jgi:mono/diheme cytochrome c family protein
VSDTTVAIVFLGPAHSVITGWGFRMSRIERLLAALLVAASAVALPVAQAQSTATPASEEPPPKFETSYLSDPKVLASGKEVWDQQCRHCHGASAYPGKAPKLNPGSYTPDFVYDRVTYGFRKMPPWKEVFSIEQRKAVSAYVKSAAFSP